MSAFNALKGLKMLGWLLYSPKISFWVGGANPSVTGRWYVPELPHHTLERWFWTNLYISLSLWPIQIQDPDLGTGLKTAHIPRGLQIDLGCCFLLGFHNYPARCHPDAATLEKSTRHPINTNKWIQARIRKFRRKHFQVVEVTVTSQWALWGTCMSGPVPLETHPDMCPTW